MPNPIALSRTTALASGFSPIVYNPVLWLDGSDSTTLFTDTSLTTPATTNGANVKGWKDKSIYKNHATQATNPPTLATSVQNSKNVVRFNGSNQRLAMTGVQMSAPYTVFVVGKKASSGSIFELAGTTAVNSHYLLEGYSDNKLYTTQFKRGTATFSYTVENSANTAFHSGFCLIYQYYSGTSVILNRNGAAVTATPSSTTSAAAGAPWAYIGYGDTSYCNGDIAETIWFNYTLSSQQLTDMASYLNTKWGVY